MKSLNIGIARAGTPNNYLLNEDTRYISMFGNKPEVTFSIPFGHDKLIEKIGKLRYNEADPSAAEESIAFFQRVTTKLLQDLKYLTIEESDNSPLHIRLVTTPLELAQIPFEFFLCPPNISEGKEIPLLAHPNRTITLTREIRQESEKNYTWPHKPRILFAWAHPDPKLPVPYEEHQAILDELVRPLARPISSSPYPDPNLEEYLTILPHASVEAIKQKVSDAQKENKPFTHIHILAHGGSQILHASVLEFRLMLCRNNTTDKVKRVTGESLAKALVPNIQQAPPAVVSLSVCDSGNIGNTILPSGSVAYQLHQAGIPCIVASQFPLTKFGSAILLKTLFHRLVNGYDPRVALYETRIALKKEQSHDWASLITYARFPEDIEEQLQSSQLKWGFDAMKVSNSWVDHIFKYWEKLSEEQLEELFSKIKERLILSIGRLEQLLDANKDSILKSEKLKSEHFGLLGSSFKRKAEFLYRWAGLNPHRKTELISEIYESLENAKIYYKKGFDADPLSHWNATQYLALQAISKGSTSSDKDLWTIAKFMAERDEQTATNQASKIWAWGTLAELYLLMPYCGLGSDAKEDEHAINQAIQLIQKISDSDNSFEYAKESTARQLERYINWWPDVYLDSFPASLAVNAKKLRELLPSLEEFS